MKRWRAVLGLVAGVFLVLSSAAHSLLGWKQLGAELSAAQAPADLILGLRLGWQFAGVAMLAFGVLVITWFAKRVRGEPVSSLSPAIIAAAYLGFGAWALVASSLNPFFFFVFIVPGLLLAVAAPAAAARRQ